MSNHSERMGSLLGSWMRAVYGSLLTHSTDAQEALCVIEGTHIPVVPATTARKTVSQKNKQNKPRER